MNSGTKVAILLLNLGGPGSLKEVRPFLYNLFSDPEIISLPCSKLLQKPLAWLISAARSRITRANYQKIGGRSPILPATMAQGEELKASLNREGIDVNVYIGMRYWNPYIEDAVKQIISDGTEILIVIPLFPQYSLTTTGSSFNELNRIISRYDNKPFILTVDHFYNHPDYLNAMNYTIKEALKENQWGCPRGQVTILFSAHSLPESFVKKTADVYPKQVEGTARELIKMGFPDNPWQICYQSKIGPFKWLEPSIDKTLKRLSRQEKDNILIVPVSFVSDHIETFYEIDILYLPMAKRLGISHCYRTKSLNNNPTFISALVNMAKMELNKLNQPSGVKR